MTHRSAVALLVVWLSLTCLFTTANINPVPIYHAADERIVASNSPNAQGPPLTGESFPNRPTATRYTRRFSRPHKLLNVTKPNNVDWAVQGKPDVKRTFVSPNSLWSDDDDKGAVDDRLSHNEVKVTAPRLVGGAEPLSDAAEVEDSNSLADALIWEGRDADVNEYPKKPNAIDAKVTSTDAIDLSLTTSTAHNTIHNMHGTHNTNDTNTTLCLDTHTIAITAQHYAQYIKPYLAWFIQYASDTYESKSEQQNIINIKKLAPVKRRASSLLNRVLRKVNETAHALTTTEDESTTTSTSADAASSSDHDDQEHVHRLGEVTDKHALEQLQCTIDSLNRVVSGKDASISELVQRLATLEKELYSIQHTTGTTHTTLPAHTLSSKSTSEYAIDTDIPTVTSSTSAPAESSPQPTTPTTSSSALDTNSDTYTTLQGVLKTLHNVSMLMDEVSTQCAITHNATTYQAIASNTSTDSTANPTASDLAIGLIDSTISVPLVYAPVIVRTVYPSIVDEVMVERRKEELYLQSLYDAAAVASLVLKSVHSSCNTSCTSTDGAGGKTTTTSRSTNFGDESAPDQPPDVLQAQIQILTARAMALEKELNLASLQLCQLRGQHYQPHIASGSGEDTKDRSWFDRF